MIQMKLSQLQTFHKLHPLKNILFEAFHILNQGINSQNLCYPKFDITTKWAF